MIVIGFQVLWVIYDRLSYRVGKPDFLDRITIQPGPMSWLCCLVCTLFCISFGFMTVTSVILNDDVLFWITLGPPLTLLMGFGVYVSCWTRLRVNGAYVEHRGAKGWQSFDWEDVEGLFNHSVLGSRLHVRGVKPLPVWAYGQGAREVAELFALYEKPFAP